MWRAIVLEFDECSQIAHLAREKDTNELETDTRCSDGAYKGQVVRAPSEGPAIEKARTDITWSQ